MSKEIIHLPLFFQDYNITEKQYTTHRRKYGQTYSKGEKLRDVKLLHANQTTENWINRQDYHQQKTQKSIFGQNKHSSKPVESTLRSFTPPNKNPDDNFRSNLLSKIPINSTIVTGGNLLAPATSPNSTPMNRSFNDDLKPTKLFDMNTSTIADESDQLAATNAATKLTKLIYNNALDAFSLIENRKGFLNTSAINCASVGSANGVAAATRPIIGVYCIRWRRTGANVENETKLIINSIGQLR